MSDAKKAAYELDVSRTASTEDDYLETWDDSSIESGEENEDEEIFAVKVVTDKCHKASDLRCYKETVSYKRWFDASVKEHPNSVCATSPVSALCGIDIKIYYRKTDEFRTETRRRRRCPPTTVLPVNKVATMLTFHPNTGLYDHLIRGKAYIVLGNGSTKASRRTVWMLQELISEYKGKYHSYGADFSREGQMELLKACVQFKKGKWVPRSVYGMALTQTPKNEGAGWKEHRSYPDDEVTIEVHQDEGPMKRSSASHWFISAYSIKDMEEAVQASSSP